MLLLLACAGPGGTTGSPAAAAPPILWISMDTVRADHLSLYGGRAEVPNLAAFAKDAIVYDHAYSHFPETALSHWSMLTGVLPEVHGNVPATGRSAYTGATAAEIAHAHGYATAAFIGGVTLQREASGLDRGFDLYDDRFTVDPADMRRPGAEVTAKAREWISRQGERPWFAFVHYFDAHFPYTPTDPRRYDPDYSGSLDGTDAALGRYRDRVVTDLPQRDLDHVVALYDAELTELDGTLAPLLQSLHGDEIVVITADHGESFENGYLFNHRGSLADGVLHVPLVIRVPGTAGTHVTQAVGLTDVLPTVLAAAHIATDAPFQGSSVLPPVATDHDVWSRTDPWLPGCVAGSRPGPLLALRRLPWKVIWGADGGDAWDLVADPGERHPVAIPDLLAGARESYAGLLAGMKPHQTAVADTRALHPGEGEMLEQLGYLDPTAPAPARNPCDGEHAGTPGTRPPGAPGPGASPPGPGPSQPSSGASGPGAPQSGPGTPQTGRTALQGTGTFGPPDRGGSGPPRGGGDGTTSAPGRPPSPPPARR